VVTGVGPKRWAISMPNLDALGAQFGAALGATLHGVPTTRKRHSVTETERVERALQPLRDAGVPIDFTELVARGAESVADELAASVADDERRLVLRRAFVQRSASGTGYDVPAVGDARALAWER
jgi:galactokinase